MAAAVLSGPRPPLTLHRTRPSAPSSPPLNRLRPLTALAHRGPWVHRRAALQLAQGRGRIEVHLKGHAHEHTQGQIQGQPQGDTQGSGRAQGQVALQRICRGGAMAAEARDKTGRGGPEERAALSGGTPRVSETLKTGSGPRVEVTATTSSSTLRRPGPRESPGTDSRVGVPGSLRRRLRGAGSRATAGGSATAGDSATAGGYATAGAFKNSEGFLRSRTSFGRSGGVSGGSRVPRGTVGGLAVWGRARGRVAVAAAASSDAAAGTEQTDGGGATEKQEVDLGRLFRQFWRVGAPFWTTSEGRVGARWKLAAVLALTVGTTVVSVVFNFLGRDFFNALESKNSEAFVRQLLLYLAGYVLGIPVFVFRSYLRDTLALEWRAWMTNDFLSRYLSQRSYYSIQTLGLLDNPDQRINDDVAAFASTALYQFLGLFNAVIDLVSFSGILYSIYPPLFGVVFLYAAAGTLISGWLGKDLVGLNFQQEKKEADFRYGLVRLRENAESIAFYGGERSEQGRLLAYFRQTVKNFSTKLVVERNLSFFTLFYQYLIQLLPVAILASLFFKGRIQFGEISQATSAFNSVLDDCSLVVYQFESFSAFSAVVERLGEFQEVLDAQEQLQLGAPEADEAEGTPAGVQEPAAADGPAPTSGRASPAELAATAAVAAGAVAAVATAAGSVLFTRSRIQILDLPAPAAAQEAAAGRGDGSPAARPGDALLDLDSVTLFTPSYSSCLLTDLSLSLREGGHLLIVGPSGAGKTSLLRAIAGLWQSGSGTIRRRVLPAGTSTPGVPTADTPPNSQLSEQPPGGVGEAPGEGREGGGDRAGSLSAGNSILFVPQKPYMVLGTLRDQMLYPASAHRLQAGTPVPEVDPVAEKVGAVAAGGDSGKGQDKGDGNAKGSLAQASPSDAELLEVLEKVRLGYLGDRWAGGLDAEVEWSSTLSLGEQQRIAFARVLLASPRLVLLDEATSALDEETEGLLYEALEESGTTYVSVGHRRSLLLYHKEALCLTPCKEEGEAPLDATLPSLFWKLEPIQDEEDPISAS